MRRLATRTIRSVRSRSVEGQRGPTTIQEPERRSGTPTRPRPPRRTRTLAGFALLGASLLLVSAGTVGARGGGGGGNGGGGHGGGENEFGNVGGFGGNAGLAVGGGGHLVGGGNVGVALAPLTASPVPRTANSEIVDHGAAVMLGKALFWDMQAGGDGQIACATCHSHAGADNRTMNTINPGPDGVFRVVSGPGQVFLGGSVSVDDIVGSQGIVGSVFQGISDDPTQPADDCSANPIAPYFGDRRVTGRNAPTVIGAIYNRNNFWDGRANHRFNGQDPFGATGNAGGNIGTLMENASLASQAVGPPNNPTEMSCQGRTFNGVQSLGAKLLARPPLQFQWVSPTDSVLGSLSAFPDPGLTVSYQQLIEAAFGPALAAVAQDQFSRIWGEAIRAYEETLVPDQTPLDRFLAGDRTALTASQQRGLNIFTGKGACTKCHAGPMMTDATVAFAASKGVVNEDGGDQGFHNTGVRPTSEDLGRAGLGPNGVSFGESGSVFNRGAFKTPTLRNVKLTAPYFHDGSKATLAEVVDFYDHGGDFRNPELAKRMKPLHLGASDKIALVDFLTNATTDCRVEKERAPFDHPSLSLPNGPDLWEVGAEGTGTCP
jgi:cytochrome c peroxidase